MTDLRELLAEWGIASERAASGGVASDATLHPPGVEPTSDTALGDFGIEFPHPDPTWIRPRSWSGCNYMFDVLPKLHNSGRGIFTLLTGPAGTGKTHAIRQYAALQGKGYLRLDCHRELTPTALMAGTQRIRIGQDGGDYFCPGALLIAARTGCVLHLEEINAMHPAVQLVLNGKADRDVINLQIPQTGEHIRWERPMIFGACNEGYSGTSAIQEALRDRFDCVECCYLPECDEAQLVSSRTGIDIDLALKAVSVANAIRQASAKGQLAFDLSPRALFSFGLRVSAGQAPSEAWHEAVIQRIPNLLHTRSAREAVARITEAVGGFAAPASESEASS